MFIGRLHLVALGKYYISQAGSAIRAFGQKTDWEPNRNQQRKQALNPSPGSRLFGFAFRGQFDAPANLVVGGQILKVGLGEGVKPMEPFAGLQLSECKERTVGGVASLHGALFENFHEVGAEFSGG
jgi:hypothetical protein